MGGTYEGGKLAAQINKELYGDDFYRRIGAIGGKKKGKKGGFASQVVGKDGLTGKERAKIFGSIGGKKSRRGPA